MARSRQPKILGFGPLSLNLETRDWENRPQALTVKVRDPNRQDPSSRQELQGFRLGPFRALGSQGLSGRNPPRTER